MSFFNKVVETNKTNSSVVSTRIFDPLRTVIYLSTFLVLTPITIIVSFLSLPSLSLNQIQPDESLQENFVQIPQFGVQVYAALPKHQNWIAGSPSGADARVEIIRQYLEKYKSPLLGQESLLVAIADQYNLDFRLLVAIAQQESNLCKKIPEGSYNCWGWGIHSRGTLVFPDYPTAIQAVAQGLREEYLDKGYVTLEEIMSKYTPYSNGSWTFGVNQFMAEME